MGDPKKIRRKFTGPRHPWQRQRLENERELLKEYGLKNKTELWKMVSVLSSFSDQSKKLTPQLQQVQRKAQAEKEMKSFIDKLSSLGLLSLRATLSDVLGLGIRDVLERRLQTLVYKKGFARSVDQARQFITHGHIAVNGKKITSPSYLVRIKEEANIGFSSGSSLNDPNHPERSTVVENKEKAPEKSDESPTEKKADDSEEKKSESAPEEPESSKENSEEPKESEEKKGESE